MKVFWKNFHSLNIDFWLTTFAAVFCFVSVIPFQQNVIAMYRGEFHFTTLNVEIIIALPTVLVMIFSPFTGILIEKSPNKIWYFLLAPLFNFIAHMMLTFVDDGKYHTILPTLAMILSGLGYSLLNGAVWTIYNLLCKNEILGTSMGILYTLMSLGFAVSYYVMDLCIDWYVWEGKFRVSNLFLAGQCVVALGLIVALNTYDN